MENKGKELASQYAKLLRDQKREREAKQFELEIHCMNGRTHLRAVEKLISNYNSGFAL